MAFAISAGYIEAINRPLPPPAPRIQLAWNRTATYEQIWREQPEVRTVVGFLARNIAHLGIHVYQRVSDTDRKRLVDHPVAQLLRKPGMRVTRYRLIEALVHDLGIYDNALWLKMKTSAGVAGLLRLPPSHVEPLGGSWVSADSYRIRGSGGHRDVSADDVVHFHGYNPADPRWGVSPMETLRGILAESHEAARWREQLWRNGARIPGWIERPPNAPEWTKESRERFREDWRGLYTGTGSNPGGTPVLEDGMQFHGEGITPKDAEYISTRKLTREEVAAAYHIPLPMVGILDHATFSNIKEQHKHLYQDTLGPWLTMLTEEIALQLLPDLDTTSGVYVEFNMAEKLRGDMEEQASSLQTAVGGPWLTRNEARARQNLPRIDGGDELIVPLNVITGGQASPTDSAPKANLTVHRKSDPRRLKGKASDDQARQVAKVLRQFFRRQRIAVLSAMGAKAPSWWDGKRWEEELTDDLLVVSLRLTEEVAADALDELGQDPDGYSVARTRKFLTAVAERRAKWINDTTLQQLQDADDPAEVFELAETSRADQSAVTLATTLAGFAVTEAVKQASGGRGTKTWVVTSGNPRPEHAAMDGETVPVGSEFSNGAQWPGDPVLGVDGVAGCTCNVEVEI